MAADGTVNSVPLPMSHASALYRSLQYPTPSIDPHIRHQSPHIHPPLSRTYFSSSVLLPSFQMLQRGRGWYTPPVNIGPDFCRSSGLDVSSLPSKFVFLPLFLFCLRFWFIYPSVPRWDLVRPCYVPGFHLLHLYNVYLFLDVRYAAYSFALPSFPSPARPSALPKQVSGFVVSPSRKQRHFLTQTLFAVDPPSLWGIGWLRMILITLPGSDNF